MTLRAGLLGVLLWGATSCAPLNTATMSDRCSGLYNACLNSCPDASARVPPGSTITTRSLQMDVAGCVNACNDKAKECH